MCLAVLLHRRIDQFPIVLAANREESYGRSSLSPHWFGNQAVFAGRDETAGGTWLGVNPHGLVVAVTNRHDGRQPEPNERAAVQDRRSRGLLCLDALTFETASEARTWVDGHLEAAQYNPFNLLIVDCRDAFVVHGADRHGIVELEPGLHILSETDVDDRANPSVTRAFELIGDRLDDTVSTAEDVMRSVMVQHGDEARQREWMCRHLTQGGTVSSAILAAPDKGHDEARYSFAPGPPCSHSYEDLSALLQEGPAAC